jgi:hypothetical protein
MRFGECMTEREVELEKRGKYPGRGTNSKTSCCTEIDEGTASIELYHTDSEQAIQ